MEGFKAGARWSRTVMAMFALLLCGASPASAGVSVGTGPGSNKVIVFDSDSGPIDNTVKIVCGNDAKVKLIVNGTAEAVNVNCSAVIEATFDMRDGNDIVDASAVTGAQFPALGEDLRAYGGPGNDTINFATSPSPATSYVRSGFRAEGGLGDDVIHVWFRDYASGYKGSGDPNDPEPPGSNDTVVFTGGSAEVRDFVQPFVNQGEIDDPFEGYIAIFGFMENVHLNGGGGADTFDVSAFSGRTTQAGLAGNDHLIAGPGGASLDGGEGDDRLIPGPVNDLLAGGPGADRLEKAGPGFNLSPSQLTGAGTDVVDGVEGALLTLTGPGTLDASTWLGSTTLTGSAGNDVLLGGRGGDTIRGDAGDDRVLGGPGADDLGGGLGSDTLSYEGLADPVRVHLGQPQGGVAGSLDGLQADFEHLEGGSGNDRLTGDDSTNVIKGGPGHDILEGRAGVDVLDAGDGRDVMLPGPGGAGDGDSFVGGPGADMVSYARRNTAVTVVLGEGADDGSAGEKDDVRADVEVLAGGQAADTLSISPAAATAGLPPQRPRTYVVTGLGGSDQVTGGPGNDALGGGAGNDRISGGSGNDAVIGGGGNDAIAAGAGNDRIRGNAGVDRVAGEAGDDVIFSLDKAADKTTCGKGADKVFGDRSEAKPLPAKGTTLPASRLAGGCDQKLARRVAPKTEGEGEIAEANEDGTDDTMSDADGFFGEGEEDKPDGPESEEDDPGESEEGNGLGDPNNDGTTLGEDDGAGFAEDMGAGGVGEFDFDDFGDDFDDDLFGEGFDDFGDAFGDDEGGKTDGPEVSSPRLELERRRNVEVTVQCPKHADQRCIGEISLVKQGKKVRILGRKAFGMPRGKKRKFTVKLGAKNAKGLAIPRKGTDIEVVVDARDRGTSLWQTTETLKLRRG